MRRWTIFLLLLLFFTACQADEATATGFLRGDFAFIPYEDRVQVVDIADVTNPQLITEFSLPGNVVKVMVNGRYLYIAHSTNSSSWDSQTGPPDAGLQIVDVSDPTQPQMAGHFYSKSLPTDLALYNNLVYLSSYDFLDTIDVSNREAPQLLSTFPEGGTNLMRDGEQLVVGWGGCSFRSGVCGGGFNLFDLSEPEKPAQIAHFQGNEIPAYDIVLANGTAFGTGKGMWAMSLADLEELQINGRYPLDNGWLYSAKILVAGNLAYTLQHDGLYIFDISQPTMPQWVGAYPTINPFTDLALRDGRLYITGWFEMLILDVTDPTFPDLLGQYAIEYPAQISPQPTATP